jgi:hypothetical protein
MPAALAALTAAAQEPTFMDAATHPGAGQIYSRLLFSHSEYRENGTDADLSTATLKLSYGIRPTLAAVLESEFADLSAGGSDETGLRETTLQLKYRLFKRDMSPLNTWRTSILGGVALPGNMDTASPDHAYPQCSLVSTAILGRHGVNAALGWKEYGHEADRFAVNGSHLYRLSPSEYTVDTQGAWYTMVESLNQFTDDGDARYDLAAGILYEARRWAWELSVRLPAAQDSRREYDYSVTTGIRFLP